MARSRRRLLRGVVLVAVALLLWLGQRFDWRLPAGSPAAGEAAVLEAFERRASGIEVEVEGRVERVLGDDLEGSRHQRFIVELAGGHTLLVAHNIDLAPRVPIEVGDPVTVRGEYEWNERGGVVHWTHHDPGGRRAGGFVRHRGRDYR